jgi:hypothetical protein
MKRKTNEPLIVYSAVLPGGAVIYALHPFCDDDRTVEHKCRALFVGDIVWMRQGAKDGEAWLDHEFDSLADGLAWLVEDEQ